MDKTVRAEGVDVRDLQAQLDLEKVSSVRFDRSGFRKLSRTIYSFVGSAADGVRPHQPCRGGSRLIIVS